MEEVDSSIQLVSIFELLLINAVQACSLSSNSILPINRGHKAKMDRLQDAVQKFPGLFLGGNYRTGVSLGDCIAAGGEIARNVSSYLEALR